MCCFDKMLLSAVVQCFHQEILECSFSSVSSLGFIVQLSKWLNLHLAVEPIVFNKSLYPFPNMPGHRGKSSKKKWYLKLGGEWYVCVKLCVPKCYPKIAVPWDTKWSHDCLLERNTVPPRFIMLWVSVLLLEKKIVKCGFPSEKLHDLVHKREKHFLACLTFHGG